MFLEFLEQLWNRIALPVPDRLLTIVYEISDRQIVLTSIKKTEVGQQKTVSGKVTDSSGTPLPGVTVVVKGTTQGVITGTDGSYSFTNVLSNATLVFSFVGMRAQEIPVNERAVINVTLTEEAIGIEEVVAIGYGTQKKISLTGAVTSVKPTSLPVGSVVRVDQMLQGRASGVLVTSTDGAPGATTSIRIRGNNSITAGSEPLYVVDGIIGEGDLNTLNPNDIASIEVLKDVSSTAIYGSRGSNGVILITTKRGQAGKDRININIQNGWQSLPREIAMLNGTEYAELLNESLTFRGQPAIFSDPSPFGEGTDWQKEITRTAPLTSVNLSMAGGTKLKYYLSGNYYDQKGIILNSGIKRYQFRLNLDNEFSEKFKIGTSINLGNANTRNKTVQLAGGSAGSALSTSPVIPIYNEDGEFSSIDPNPASVGEFNNPVAQATLPKNSTNSTTLQGNFFAIYQPIKELSFKSTFGITASNTKNKNYTPGKLAYQRYTGQGGQAGISQSDGVTWQNENTLNFSKQLNEDNKFDVLAGITFQKGISEGLSASAIRFATDANTWNNLSTGDPLSRNIGSSYSSWSIVSFLARVNYSLKDRYLFTLVGRYDGSSRLGDNNKYASFPSAAFAWILSEEQFIKDLNIFSLLKLRTSYGISGNQAVGIYQTLPTLSATSFVQGDAKSVALKPSRLENPDLKWETLSQFDLGVETGFYDNKLQIEIDYYKSLTKDLLLDQEIPQQSGYTTMLRNVGEVSNEGIELSVNTININRRQFQWKTIFNISSNRNKVVSLGTKDEIITHRYNQGLQPDGILRVGEPIGSFYGAVTEGLWHSQEEITSVGTMPSAQPGTRRYKDVDGSGKFSDGSDYIILGNGNPKFFGGIGNTFKYKNIELDFFFQGTYGNKIYNGWAAYNGSSDPTTNQFEDAVNRWRPDNPDSDIPRAGGNFQGSERTPSDKWIFDGSYLRLKTLSINYTLPLNQYKNSIIQNISLSLTGNNLWLLSGYDKGYDPEVNTFGTSSILRGYDYAAYPNYRSFSLGINVVF